ncbi:MAG: rod shape-determining protein MreC [Candidatus Portnoybacteria bacterium CG10_big_fil_rev_8_21_14_0_10_44_7]|uniref:Cell shape-determining protein MreC n=1 Tax=Candidatus Portnoybacteria bacterium CG10_big_fil_rev_8_21_14_0_10_44_7 TaxID=1974816 RepID=A0A2M8KIF5_9BACT|nr:MAG: rod shape-determining protein MreC [Candidatus Portnoybacteria bacterium CG10_big_fil_rev_8_21_14_0_10_44_7]
MARSKKQKLIKVFLAIFFLLAAFFGLSFFNWQAPWLKNTSYFLVHRPVLATFNFLGEKAGGAVTFFEGLFFRGEEKKQLQEMIAVLRSENTRLKEVVKENNFLKENANILKSSQNEFILAKIIAKDQSDASGILVINKGRQDGVQEGQAVIAGQSVLLGSIFEVGKRFAKIRLLVDPQSRVNVLVQGKNLQGVVVGQYGLGLLLDKVTRDVGLNVGDTIISSGLGYDFPGGLLIGWVEQITKQAAEVYQSAFLRPAAQVSILDYVFIFK